MPTSRDAVSMESWTKKPDCVQGYLKYCWGATGSHGAGSKGRPAYCTCE